MSAGVRSPGVALVTGASSGIGAALSEVLAREGWAVGLLARRADALEAVQSRIRGAGGRANMAPADLLDTEAAAAATRRVEDALGPIDLLVLNAGLSAASKPLAPDAGGFEREMQVNVLGAVRMIAAVVPGMAARGRGHVVAVSSLAAIRGLPGAAGYCASKAALSHMMESYRLDWARAGIRTTTIHPGFIRTPLTADADHAQPMLMDLDRGVALVARAIRRGRKTAYFPRRLAWLLRASRILPDGLVRRFAGR